MEPKFQSSFIPRTPVLPSTPKASVPPRYTSISFLPSLGTLIFILALAAWGGLWLYARSLSTNIATDQRSLAETEQAFNPTAVDTVLQASNRIKSAQQLLGNHVALSRLFAELEAAVLPTVKFDSFTFQNNTDGTLGMSVSGEAASYAALAEQSALFANLSSVTHQQWNSLGLSSSGSIDMEWTASVDPSLVKYQGVTQVEPSVPTPTQTVATSTASTTTP